MLQGGQFGKYEFSKQRVLRNKQKNSKIKIKQFSDPSKRLRVETLGVGDPVGSNPLGKQGEGKRGEGNKAQGKQGEGELSAPPVGGPGLLGQIGHLAGHLTSEIGRCFSFIDGNAVQIHQY